ncbi:MAG: hypothetical protein KAH04_06330, partial [Psychrilyobacter sp.]|nr:hypothetical protein [Psychrilyobacter sp.]
MKRIMLLISMFSIIGNVSSFATSSTPKNINQSILNYDSLNGTGYFVNAKGGTMGNQNGKPFDDVTGKAYVSGDFAENNPNDTIIPTTKVFSAQKFSGTAVSDSPFFKAFIYNIPNTKDYSFELRRKLDIKFIKSFTFDTETVKYTMSTNPSNEISGDATVSGLLFDTTGSSVDVVNTNNFSATLHLNSNLLLTNLRKVNTSGTTYSFKVDVRKFSSLITNEDVGQYLDSNSSKSNNSYSKLFFSNMFNVSTKEKLNSILNETFGTTIFPTLTKQTFD